MEFEKIYENMTSVNVNEQQKIWDERGKGYYGEYLVFHELFNCVPGFAKFLMNIEVPKQNGETTEIDLVCIHETGIYVFEIKHYKGTIYGSENQKNWVQWFRTVKSNHFYNPILQNRGHIEALQHNLPDKKFYSYVVFTNPDVELRIKDSTSVYKIGTLAANICNIMNRANKLYTSTEIEQVYNTLLPYSKVKNSTFPLDDTNISFDEFITLISKERKIYKKENKKIKKRSAIHTVLNSLITIGLVACAIFGVTWNDTERTENREERTQIREMLEEAEKERAATEEELELLKSKFTHVAPLNGDNLEITDDMITVSDFSITASPDIKNAVVLNGKISINSEKYSLYFKNSKIVVQLKNGNVQEYDLPTYDSGNIGFSEKFRYYKDYVLLSRDEHSLVLHKLQPQDIEYIKMDGLCLCQVLSGAVIKSDIDIELYNNSDK